ncbi:phosphoglucomutase [Mesonia hippocampi]|uniref:Phosphoglucomutase n=1 Tax=Mesonia hippocampi TaxID=1628250 RepID=A0A840ERM4_9FLAO|nr:phospho-sugar mutase [Mesonia hippocampi]MBB4118006.1 phosphoglucomutase [Mesonia hippocampi]
MTEILEKAKLWLTDIFDTHTQEQVKQLITSNPKELEDSFYKNLAFGTGGMRGIMGVGTNRINKYTLGKNTQGIALYLKEKFPDEELKIAIAYDCRNNSKELAYTVANVFSANNINVYIFEDLRPTPELSFAVKKYNCQCGIVLTASHNPPEYNGYKVYWKDGGQLVPPQDGEIIEKINSLTYAQIKFEAKPSYIQKIGIETDSAFVTESVKNASFNTNKATKENLSIVFTALHGTSITLLPKVLEKAGYTQLHIVEEQATPNGNFPTVKSPNPEEPAALEMAIDLANKKNADIVIGTDPDSDRLGIAVRNKEGEIVLLNGNQTMILMTDFLLKNYQEKQGFKGNEFIASTIVSTPMMPKLAEYYGIECKLGLTGFKWIAKMIKDFPNQHFIGGGEESFGFMVGDFVRDKDAITASLLACEIAAQAKAEGKTLLDKLNQLYLKHGLYQEHLISLVKKGISGAQEIKNIMHKLRENPPLDFNGIKTTLIEDYQTSQRKDLTNNTNSALSIPSSNVLIFYLEDGTKIAARPSGTEPKIKFYISVNTTVNTTEQLAIKQNELTKKIQAISAFFNAY